MLRIGLTGGIGSGKSTVADLFAGHGISVIDTDRIARDIVAPGSALLQRIAATFGDEVIAPDGSLDRAHLRQIIFAEPGKRQQLENLLHPVIREHTLARITHAPGPYCIIVVPLLLEKGWQSVVDRILVVDTPVELQISRTCHRDGLSAAEVHAILATQFSREERLAAADDVIVNDADRDKLVLQVEQLHRSYLELATARG